MKSNRLIIGAFILVSLAQLFVPFQMISNQAGSLEKGNEFRFRTYNRYNPDFNGIGSDLNGKFIWLKFREDHFKITDKKYWEKVRKAYVVFTTDSNGYAKIKSVVILKPEGTPNWVRARVSVNWKDTTRLQLFYPFSSYYIQDAQIKKIESIIKNELCDTLKTSYLKIQLNENQFTSGDLIIGGVPFKEWIGKTE